MTQRMLPEFS